MALFQVGRLVSLPPAAHCSCTHAVLVLFIFMIMCPDLLSSSHAKPCKCSSSSDQLDQRAYTTVNTTLDQIGAYFCFTPGSSSLPNVSTSWSSIIVPYYGSNRTYYLQMFNSSDRGSLIIPLPTSLWEKSDDGTNLNEASFNVSFSLSSSRSSTSSNQQEVGSQLMFAILPAYYNSIDFPGIIPPTGSSNFSSQPVTIADSQVSVNITSVDKITISDYNNTAFDDFSKLTWIEISIQPLQTSSAGAGASSNYTVWIQYDRNRQLLSVYVIDSGKPKPDYPVAYLDRAISNITEPLTRFAFFSSLGQLLQLYTWNSTVEVLPGNIVSSSSTGKWSTATIVSVVLGPSVAIGAVVAATVYLYFNSKYRRWKKDFDQLAKSMQQLPGVPIQVSFSDIQKATNNFHEMMKLGRGGFGAVYRCRLPAPVKGEVLEVAVKKFTRDDNRRYEDFLAEVSIINRLRHKNIVPLIGWSYNKGEPLLIYDYMPNGSLDQHLFRRSDQQQNNSPICQWATRYNIVMDVATGLQYVHHEYEPTVLHRDIKASNIMIDSTFQGRLGDFGLACTVDMGRNSYTDRDPRGTPGFIAYEYLHTRRATRMTDAYAFGVLILEIVTGKPPIGRYGKFDHITDWVWHLHREGKPLEAVDPVVTKEQFDSSDARRLLLLGLACSSPNPSERPSMIKALQVITKLLPPPDVPFQKPRFMWPPEDESSSLSPYLRTANTSLESSSRQVSSENAGSIGQGFFFGSEKNFGTH